MWLAFRSKNTAGLLAIFLLVAFLVGVISMISALLIASRKVSLRHETR